MFRSRSTTRSRGPQPIPVPAPIQYGHQNEGKSATKRGWKPSLRRIKNGLFSSKDATQTPEHRSPQETTYATPSPKSKNIFQRKSKKPQQAPVVETPPARPRYAKVNAPNRPPSPGRPKTSREKSSKGIDVLRKTLTREGTSTSGLQNFNRSATQEQEERGPILRPDPQYYSGASAYAPKHAPTDFRHNTRQRRTQTEVERPKTAAYVPKHAATDFYKMNMTASASTTNLSQHEAPGEAPTETTDPVIQEMPAAAPAVEPEEENNDFQNFLRESRLAAAQSYNSYGVISLGYPNRLNSETSRVMDNIINTHRTNERHKAMSISARTQKTSTSRASKRGSIIEMVHEYVKPTRPQSMYIAHPSITDKRISRGSAYFAQARFDADDPSRWSQMGESIRRSFSRDRDNGGVQALKDLRTRTEKRRSYVMPTSTGLIKYNQGVIAGKYYT